MFQSIALSLVLSGMTFFGSTANNGAPSTTEPVASTLESVVPAGFNFVGFSAEENARLNAAASCNPRSVVNSVPALRDCVLAGKIPACDYDFDAEDVSTCPDGSLRFRVIIYNDCGAAGQVQIAEIFVCNCTVESWTCL